MTVTSWSNSNSLWSCSGAGWESCCCLQSWGAGWRQLCRALLASSLSFTLCDVQECKAPSYLRPGLNPTGISDAAPGFSYSISQWWNLDKITSLPQDNVHMKMQGCEKLGDTHCIRPLIFNITNSRSLFYFMHVAQSISKSLCFDEEAICLWPEWHHKVLTATSHGSETWQYMISQPHISSLPVVPWNSQISSPMMSFSFVRQMNPWFLQ